MTRAQVSRVMGLELLKGHGTAFGGMVLDVSPNLATADGKAAWQKMKDAGNLDNARRAYGAKAYAWEEPWDVAPTAHFHMGGVRIDEHGASSVSGLYAAGEVAGGLHGANRLGSVALAELFIFGRRAGAAAAAFARGADRPALPRSAAGAAVADIEGLIGAQGETRPVVLARSLQRLMWSNVGVVRSEEPLATAVAGLKSAVAEGILGRRATAVALITGNGLKDVQSARAAAGRPYDIEPDGDALEEILLERKLIE